MISTSNPGFNFPDVTTMPPPADPLSPSLSSTQSSADEFFETEPDEFGLF